MMGPVWLWVLREAGAVLWRVCLKWNGGGNRLGAAACGVAESVGAKSCEAADSSMKSGDAHLAVAVMSPSCKSRRSCRSGREDDEISDRNRAVAVEVAVTAGCGAAALSSRRP